MTGACTCFFISACLSRIWQLSHISINNTILLSPASLKLSMDIFLFFVFFLSFSFFYKHGNRPLSFLYTTFILSACVIVINWTTYQSLFLSTNKGLYFSGLICNISLKLCIITLSVQIILSLGMLYPLLCVNEKYVHLILMKNYFCNHTFWSRQYRDQTVKS